MKKRIMYLFLILTMVFMTMQNIVSLNAAEQLEIQISPISIGDNGMAIKEDGGLYIWGNEPSGEEDKMIFKSAASSEKVMDNAAAVSAGIYFKTVITNDGSLYTWGNNSKGQLGNGTCDNSNTPQKIMDNTVAVSAGENHCMAITSDGSLYLWGDNSCGQLGSEEYEYSSTPLKIMDDVKAISAGCNYCMAVKSDGSLYLWGENFNGMLGVTDKYGRESTTIYEPRKMMDNVKAVSAGFLHSMAITNDGSLYAWGNNTFGELGIGGTGTVVAVPQKVLNNVVDAAAGRYSSLAVTSDGGLYTWGSYPGDGTDKDSYSPRRIMENVAAVSANNSYSMNQSMAVTADGDLYVWGLNDFGKLGDGTEDGTVLVPRKILSNIMLPNNINISDGTVSEQGSSEDKNLVSAEETDYSVSVGGELIETDIKPVILDGAVLVPVRPLFEALGYEVSWIPSYGYDIQILNDDLYVSLTVGDRLINCRAREILNSKLIESKMPPRVINGSAYITLEDFTEILDASSSVDSETNIINISFNEE